MGLDQTIPQYILYYTSSKYISGSNDKPIKDVTMADFLDLSKAFDTINHDILIQKLHFYGIRGICNKWFLNYLTERKQYIEIEDVKSSLQNISFGVPQGSILGPILFLLYINDIHASTSLNLLSFADDTTIYSSGKDIPSLINTVINVQSVWSTSCVLSVSCPLICNSNKT